MKDQIIKEQYVNLNELLNLFNSVSDENSYAKWTIEDAIYNKELSSVWVVTYDTNTKGEK